MTTQGKAGWGSVLIACVTLALTTVSVQEKLPAAAAVLLLVFLSIGAVTAAIVLGIELRQLVLPKNDFVSSAGIAGWFPVDARRAAKLKAFQPVDVSVSFKNDRPTEVKFFRVSLIFKKVEQYASGVRAFGWDAQAEDLWEEDRTWPVVFSAFSTPAENNYIFTFYHLEERLPRLKDEDEFKVKLRFHMVGINRPTIEFPLDLPVNWID